jgi:hypothetical protein
MNKQKRARLVAPVTGIAGFFAFLLQFFAGGTTVDFRPVNDTFQSDEGRGQSEARTTDGVALNSLAMTEIKQREPLYKTRYRERSRFDGRGGIVDLRS